MIINAPALQGHVRSHTKIWTRLPGSAVLTFFGYIRTDRQTNKHQDKQSKYIKEKAEPRKVFCKELKMLPLNHTFLLKKVEVILDVLFHK